MKPKNYGLSLSDPDGVERWRQQAEAFERERKREHARTQREQRADTVSQLRTEVQEELAALRAEMASRQDLQREAVGQVLGEFSDEAADCTERAVKRIQIEFWNMSERRFAELNARLDVLSGSKPSSEKSRDESLVQDLPNPLPRRVN
jgi:DNA anti-recombination protein RmuC